MTTLLRELVSRPSRAGIDSPEPVLASIADWLHSHGVPHEWLRDAAGNDLALWGEIQGGRPGPTYVLDATADTAAFGDPAAWTHPPDRATVEDGWLYGRGSADSKAGIVVFCHVMVDLLAQRERLAGSVGFLFDVDEHTGGFGGIRNYMVTRGTNLPAGVMIGYPGNDRLVVGARGFLRARLSIHGVGAHSGSSHNRGINAIDRARGLLRKLTEQALPGPDEAFPLAANLTPTGIRGGGEFSLVPDLCELELDIRLTPSFDDAAARTFLTTAIKGMDAHAEVPPTSVEWLPGWPAYRLEPDHPMVQALSQSAREAFGHDIPTAVVGPSSIANYLSTLGVPATAGLGVSYRNIHAPDECVLLESLEPTFLAYRDALIRLMQ